MKKRTWKVADKAKGDLLEIAAYTTKSWGKAQKNAYLKSIKMVFDRVTEHPEAGQKRGELGKGVCSILAREHVVFYQFDSDHVYIARVLHVRRDPSRNF